MTDTGARDYVRYAAWRMRMWFRGYGSYTDIEAKVNKGQLVPGREYPDLNATGAAADGASTKGDRKLRA